MHILNIIQCTNLGGMEQASLHFLVGLKARGHSCQILSLNPIGGLGPLLKEKNILAEGLPYLGRGGWRSFPQLRRKLKPMKANALIMMGHNLLAMVALGNICKERRLLSIHYHHTGVKPAWQWRILYKMALKRFQAITFPSDFLRMEAEALYSPIASISHTIRNPILIPPLPTEAQRAVARRVLGIPQSVKVIGNAGWLIRRKRFDVFLRVAQRVALEVPNTLFLIAGDGPERERLEALAAELHVADRVQWLGWQNDLTTFYSSLDVLLFNSDWDAFPTTPLEAMGYGIPVVASLENGGLREVISEDKFGYLFPTHDIDAMAQCLTLTLLQRENTVGLAGRERIHEVCAFHRCIDSMERLLQMS